MQVTKHTWYDFEGNKKYHQFSWIKDGQAFYVRFDAEEFSSEESISLAQDYLSDIKNIEPTAKVTKDAEFIDVGAS